MKPIRKYTPFIPIIGIILILYFFVSNKKSGIEENGVIGLTSAIVQAISIGLLINLFFVPL